MKPLERWALANATGTVVRESSTTTAEDGLYYFDKPDGTRRILRSRASYEATMRMRTSSHAQRAWVGRPRP